MIFYTWYDIIVLGKANENHLHQYLIITIRLVWWLLLVDFHVFPPSFFLQVIDTASLGQGLEIQARQSLATVKAARDRHQYSASLTAGFFTLVLLEKKPLSLYVQDTVKVQVWRYQPLNPLQWFQQSGNWSWHIKEKDERWSKRTLMVFKSQLPFIHKTNSIPHFHT